MVVLSGFLAETIEVDVLALGAARFMEKDAHLDEINDAIEEVAALDGQARKDERGKHTTVAPADGARR